MKKQLIILLGLMIFNIGSSQNCIAYSLSKVYDFDIMLVSKDNNELGKAEIYVNIHDKTKFKKVCSIKFESEYILKTKSFKECQNYVKYSSNEFLKSTDNDFGDLIVADFNFDGNEDIAIKREEGSNGGPVYNFYIQNKKQKFILDKYLSYQMSYFPDYIDSVNKTLHLSIRVDSQTNKDLIYQYSEENKTWNLKI